MSFSPLAAERAYHGYPIYSAREELGRMLEPDPAEQIERRAGLLGARIRTVRDEPVASHEDRCSVVNDAIETMQANPYQCELSDDAIVAVAHALSNPDVRDCWIAAALADHAVAAERLWTRLIQAAPPPQRACPATLLAIYAYLRGSGSLANSALDIALNAEPHNVLAAALRAAFAVGMPRDRLRAFLQRSAVAIKRCQARH